MQSNKPGAKPNLDKFGYETDDVSLTKRLGYFASSMTSMALTSA
jgi:hypothetical protein